ncbi:MAG: tetraacyldisaccharide 4'-kinase [Bacteroidia bacterium]|nr:tetraacyldisaccharide 4'-kinase [Bacteroidia bacterium]
MRLLLLPFSWLYGLVIRIRNLAFDLGVFSQDAFAVPLIVVGNLSVGGTGKSPLVQYLARFLSQKYRVAILSRGYGRHSRGFRWVEKSSTAGEVGDEPLQYAFTLENVRIAVCERRAEGIRRLLSEHPAPQVILLDDAFQHRRVKPGFSILLTEYSRPFTRDFLLPAGRLREPVQAKKRADAMVLSKCPSVLEEAEISLLREEIAPAPAQSLHFSYIQYRDHLEGLYTGALSLSDLSTTAVLLFCGIANPEPLAAFLRQHCVALEMKRFKDHHPFSVADVLGLKSKFQGLQQAGRPSVLVTTRKDAMRLLSAEMRQHLAGLPVFVIDIETAFHKGSGDALETRVQTYLDAAFRANG